MEEMENGEFVFRKDLFFVGRRERELLKEREDRFDM